MKNHRKARRNLMLGRNAGTVHGKFNGQGDVPGVELGQRYLMVDVDDASEFDRFVALNLTTDQAESLALRLLDNVKAIRVREQGDAERLKREAEGQAFWARAAETGRVRVTPVV